LFLIGKSGALFPKSLSLDLVVVSMCVVGLTGLVFWLCPGVSASAWIPYSA